MLLVFFAFIVLILLGMPVAFSIGIAGTLFFAQHLNLPFTIPIQLAISQTQNFALLAVPLFIMSGNFMNQSGITERLLRLSTVLTGHMRGGLAQVSIALATLMGGVSGSCIADAAMQTRILGPEMLKRGFSKGYAAGILSFGSLMTPIIPPGIGFILYGTVGQVSIGRLFAGGILPGLILWVSLAVTVSLTAKKRGYKPERPKGPSPREVASATLGGIWAVLFPVMLLAGLRFGIFTPSEIGAFAVVYSFFIGVFAYRELGGRAFKEALEGSTIDVGAVMFLIALSGIFGYGIVWDRIPEVFSNVMLGITTNPYVVMILIVIFLLIAGCFIDGSVLIIMLTPIFLPIATELGFDPVHFGLVFIITITIGNFTPPVGSAMYAVCSILECDVNDYTLESLPFLVTVSLVAALLIFFPNVVLFIPDLIFGKG
ncbi:MAG: C4-dicarboxylate ABC transporter [candidate division NC10 bacterium RIFCSPLOWO2_12_FULL_66_18]|nr:MAG: C4-dicarboxylate ABC transporter [candidate division NC10 bacterium RIFCSPLOWO2_02_FULL_66_22]OGC00536.1 MAG: C4-dicarboxylate ABC transporter [candidate division NC10 bacterium RIFCSPLOWO2_12_FULL_66_18]